MLGDFFGAPPAVSIVVMVYRMPKQAMNTLESLAVPYQRGVSQEDYEVIVVENPSDEMLVKSRVLALGQRFSYYAMERNLPSPVDALNFGIGKARAPVTGLMMDGARVLTPGVLAHALMAYRITEKAVVSVPGYHLGKELQQKAVDSGYNEKVEAKLLDSVRWPEDGYELFRVSCLSGSCAGGFFVPVAESNCLFAPTKLLKQVGGCDRGFKTPGGGLANLDLYRRLCEHPETRLFLLPGEGTFHQYHRGVTTSKAFGDRDALIREMHEEYRHLRGSRYTVPDVQATMLGLLPQQAMPFILHSMQTYLAICNPGNGSRCDEKKDQIPAESHPAQMKPPLSIIVIVYRMHAQAMNTLFSLSMTYQQNCDCDDYEVVVVENASDENLDPDAVRSLEGNFRYYLRQETSQSPVFALKFALEKAKGQQLCIMVDGARMVSPGIVNYAKMARSMHDHPLIVVPGYHLGDDQQQVTSKAGYDRQTEEALLKRIRWPEDGYRLFEISCLSGSNPGGYINPMMECNCLICSKRDLDDAGGIDVRFDLIGGGMLNLDLFRRLGLLPQISLIVLLGEGSFHQFHGGVTTSHNRNRKALMDEFIAQYAGLKKGKFDGLRREPTVLGKISTRTLPFLQFSIEAAQARGRRFHKLGRPLWPDELESLGEGLKN